MRRVISVSVVALACALVPSAAAQEDRGVPILSAPYHLPVFRNEYVTLLNVFVPPGRTTGYHIHTNDSVSVNITPADMTNQPLGAPAAGPPQRGEAGRANFAAYTKANSSGRTRASRARCATRARRVWISSSSS